MRPCPACRAQMNVFSAQGLDLDACPSCSGLWFDAGELAEVVSPQLISDLLADADGQPGACKKCGETLAGVETCGACGEPAPACPECGVAPLAIGHYRDVPIDVCSRCQGIWLDAGELEKLGGKKGAPLAVQRAANRSAAGSPSDERTVCCACGRELRRNHAFEEGGSVYCGSCAPAGCSPLVAILTPKLAETNPRGWLGGSCHPHGLFNTHHHGGIDLVDFLASLFAR